MFLQEDTRKEGSAAGGSAERIRRDVERVADLAYHGFAGPTYRVFEDDLCRKSLPMLRGMLRSGKLPRLSQQKHQRRGIALYVHDEDLRLLHNSAEARDEIAVEILLRALKSFRDNGLVGGGWNPWHAGRHGACSLTTYFIGQCVWEFRRVYLRWRRARLHLAEHEVAMRSSDALLRLLQTPSHLPGPEARVAGGALSDLINKRSAESRAVVLLAHEGYDDSQIAERLKTTAAAVRQHRYRLRRDIKRAEKAGRVWLPRQLRSESGEAL
ncbi:RNA polymerase sigma factor [Streptomyces lydicus]|uniref:RNA polymerase sigma factor n=1 Tax=Streptomyces lydicus TaxID=47763 RepID=UPI0037B556F8